MADSIKGKSEPTNGLIKGRTKEVVCQILVGILVNTSKFGFSRTPLQLKFNLEGAKIK
jgi:hypothetical protein